MPTIIILDDNYEDAQEIQEKLEQIGYQHTTVVNTGKQFANEIANHDYTLAIVDIDLGGQRTGIDWAQEINLKNRLPFLLLSNHSDPEYVKLSIEIGATSYLVKGVTTDQLHVSIERARQTAKNEYIKINNQNRQIKKSDIFCLSSFGHIKKIHLLSTDKTIFVPESFKSLSERINHSPLVRVHREYYVNLDLITDYTCQMVILPKPIFRNGDTTNPITTINIGNRYRKFVLQFLDNND